MGALTKMASTGVTEFGACKLMQVQSTVQSFPDSCEVICLQSGLSENADSCSSSHHLHTCVSEGVLLLLYPEGKALENYSLPAGSPPFPGTTDTDCTLVLSHPGRTCQHPWGDCSRTSRLQPLLNTRFGFPQKDVNWKPASLAQQCRCSPSQPRRLTTSED